MKKLTIILLLLFACSISKANECYDEKVKENSKKIEVMMQFLNATVDRTVYETVMYNLHMLYATIEDECKKEDK